MRCIELFAGAGGAALGLEAAGIEHVALCEWDPDACATHGSPAEARQRDLFGRGVLPWVTMGEVLGLTGRVGSGLKGSEWGTCRPAPTLRNGNGTAGLYLVAAGVTGEGRPRPMSQPAPDERLKLNKASDALWLATGRRRLTAEECAILQKFPSDHPWQGNNEARFRQVGNAVPPRVAEVVGRCVVEADARRGDS